MKKIILLIIVILSNISYAQEIENYSGILCLDSRTALSSFDRIDNDENIKIDVRSKKSPLLAGALSFLLPGAGEFYAESYIKSIIFLAIEAAAITTSVIYDNKGDDQTDSYEAFAEEHWDVGRYARWTMANLHELKPSLNPEDYNGLFLDETRSQVSWSVLNRLEGDISGYYSHRLAPFGDQQYYEMIGKYPQFNVGWDDFGDETTSFHFGDPVTGNFSYYAGERGKANDFYNVASKAVMITVINHFISAIDAAWTTSNYNKRLKMEMSLEKTNIGYFTEIYPVLNFEYRF